MIAARRRSRRQTRIGALTAALGAGLAVAALGGPLSLPAAAHGAAGAIQLLDATPSGENTVDLQVCVTFSIDRDQADSARVTVRADGPGNATVEAQVMDVGDQPGIRTGTVEFPRPGSWTVFVESAFPVAQLVVPLTVGADDLASPAATAGGPVNTAATCKPPEKDAPAWLVAGGAGAAAIVVFGGLLLLLRRSTAAPA